MQLVEKREHVDSAVGRFGLFPESCNKQISQFVLDNPLLHPTAKLKDIIPHNSHVFFGFGLLSGKDGITVGLPIDALAMMINAARLKVVLGHHSKCHFLIADTVAIETADDPSLVGAIQLRAEKTVDQMKSIMHRLNIPSDQVVLHYESKIIEEKSYQLILEKLKTSVTTGRLAEVADVKGELLFNAGNVNYILRQTALMHYFSKILGCSVKIGWAHSNDNISLSLVDNLSHDEAFFDECYQYLFPKDNLSFVYSVAGTKLHSSNLRQTCVPYTVPARYENERLLLGDDEPAIRKKLMGSGKKLTILKLPRQLFCDIICSLAKLGCMKQPEFRNKNPSIQELMPSLVELCDLARHSQLSNKNLCF